MDLGCAGKQYGRARRSTSAAVAHMHRALLESLIFYESLLCYMFLAFGSVTEKYPTFCSVHLWFTRRGLEKSRYSNLGGLLHSCFLETVQEKEKLGEKILLVMRLFVFFDHIFLLFFSTSIMLCLEVTYCTHVHILVFFHSGPQFQAKCLCTHPLMTKLKGPIFYPF